MSKNTGVSSRSMLAGSAGCRPGFLRDARGLAPLPVLIGVFLAGVAALIAAAYAAGYWGPIAPPAPAQPQQAQPQPQPQGQQPPAGGQQAAPQPEPPRPAPSDPAAAQPPAPATTVGGSRATFNGSRQAQTGKTLPARFTVTDAEGKPAMGQFFATVTPAGESPGSPRASHGNAQIGADGMVEISLSITQSPGELDLYVSFNRDVKQLTTITVTP